MADNAAPRIFQSPNGVSDVERGKSTIDLDFIAQQSERLITLLAWIVKGPPLLGKYSLAELLDLPPLKAVAGYLNFYKIHIVVLARILASVKKGESIDAQITELESSLDAYTNEAFHVAHRVLLDIPPNPWRNIKAGPVIIVLAPLLKNDQRFVREWNNYLNIYQALVQSGVAVTSYLSDQGRDIRNETSRKVKEIREMVKGIKESINLDNVIKYRYEQRLEFIELDLGKRVQSAQSEVEKAKHYLQNTLSVVQTAQRL